MSVCVCIPCLLKGGTEFQTLHLVRALIQSGLAVSVVCYFEYDSEIVTEFKDAGAKVNLLRWERSLGFIAFIRTFSKLLKDYKPDILHVQYIAPGALPVLAAVLAKVPRVIATVHQPYTKSHGWKAKWLLRFAALFCRPFLAVSKNAQISWFGSATLIDSGRPIASQKRALTMYNTIPVSKIKELAQKEELRNNLNSINTRNSGQIIGTVSRLRHEKGIDVLIKAFAKINELLPDTQLLLVGDGPDRTKYEELAKELGIENDVMFYGEANWEQAMHLMAQMDIVVIPSRFEGFGLTAAEAMAMAKPVIVSNTYGLKELITHGKEGLVFENENVHDLFVQLTILLESRVNKEELGKNASRKAVKQFDYPVFLRNIKCLYDLAP